MKNKVFLGGTCAGTTWREQVIENIMVPFFNPIVADWTTECKEEEMFQKEDLCNVHLYVITKEMKGVFSIAEAVNSSNQKGITTILHVIPDQFEKEQLKSLTAVCDMVNKNGGIAYVDSDLKRSCRVINSCFG